MRYASFLAAGLWAILLAVSSPTLAHPGHGQELTRDAVVKRASAQVDRLIEEGKIEKSWLVSRQAGNVERRTANGKEEWVITFDNPTATDAGKRRLYVFLTASGEFVVANFSGR